MHVYVYFGLHKLYFGFGDVFAGTHSFNLEIFDIDHWIWVLSMKFFGEIMITAEVKIEKICFVALLEKLVVNIEIE